jgi:hypothetical protein
METNTLTFTFILKVEKNNDGAKDNDANHIDFVITMIENCLQLNCTPLGVAARGDFTLALGNGKMFGSKQQVKLKKKKLSKDYILR